MRIKEYSLLLNPFKKHKVAIFILKNSDDFHKFLTETTPHIEYDPEGVAYFIEFNKIKKNWIGGCVFNRENIDYSTISHELLHCVFAYFKNFKINNFYSDKNQEKFCYTHQYLLDQFIKKVNNFNIKRTSDDFEENIKYVYKKLGF